MRFRDLGARVAVYSPPDHPLHFVRGLDRHYTCPTWFPGRSLERAIKAACPDFVLPMDDLAVRELHALATANSKMESLIARSLGNPAFFSTTRSRAGLLALAGSLGIRTPRTEPLTSLSEAQGLAAAWQMPAVVKKDGTSNGSGVIFATSPAEVVEAYQKFLHWPSPMMNLKRQIINGERSAPWGAESLAPAEISLQSFVAGEPANAMFACYQGRIIESLQVRSLWSLHAAGTSMIVERMEDPRILDAGVRLASALGISGFFGLDFLLQRDSGEPILLEMNPRGTQLGHLPIDPARHGYSTLAGALWSAWTGKQEPALAFSTIAPRIAFFPQGASLPADEYGDEPAWLDIPDGEPDLARELSRMPWHRRRWIARTFEALRRPQLYQPVHHESRTSQLSLK
jgi:hypothetical protein